MGIYSKKELRKLIKEKRLNLSKEEVIRFSQVISDKIRNDLNYQKAKKVGIYLPILNEVDLTYLLNDDKEFLIPVVKPDDTMYFSKFDLKNLVKNKYGILEPKNPNPVEDIDYLLIPAIAVFNNYRVGFGKGFYDKYLEKHNVKYRVAVIYKFQEVEFRLDIWDIQNIDYVIVGD